jgi:hypothetical protein
LVSTGQRNHGGFFIACGLGHRIRTLPMQYAKPALTFDEQVTLLAARGLIIEDRAAAAEILSRISYYRLSAY